MIRILHTNDMHGTLGDEEFEVLRQFRQEADVYFDTGDIIKTGNLAIPTSPDPAWPKLAQLRCTASVMGNRESHVLNSIWTRKLAGASHPILCGNMRDKCGEYPLPRTLKISCNGVRIGIVSAMVPMVTEQMVSRNLSDFIWDQPRQSLSEQIHELRESVELLIALTHVGIAQDRLLATQFPDLDIIFGGHSHTVLTRPEMVGNVAIVQGGSHNKFAGRYSWNGKNLTGGLAPVRNLAR